jgi:hypothetical protein
MNKQNIKINEIVEEYLNTLSKMECDYEEYKDSNKFYHILTKYYNDVMLYDIKNKDGSLDYDKAVKLKEVFMVANYLTSHEELVSIYNSFIAHIVELMYRQGDEIGKPDLFNVKCVELNSYYDDVLDFYPDLIEDIKDNYVYDPLKDEYVTMKYLSLYEKYIYLKAQVRYLNSQNN